MHGDTVDGQNTLNYGNYGIFLGSAGFGPSTVVRDDRNFVLKLQHSPLETGASGD